MNVVEFTGDPMLQLEKFENMCEYIFYLNQESLDEIKSYSQVIVENIPHFFDDKHCGFILLAEGGKDENGKEYPDTYIGINNTLNTEYPYCLFAVYASDFQYSQPENGEIIFLKKQTKNNSKQ